MTDSFQRAFKLNFLRAQTCSAICAVFSTLLLHSQSSSFFFQEAATDNRSLSRVRSRQLTERMASNSRLGALEKRCGSRDSAASTADFVDETSSEESEDDFGSSDFSSDSESGDDQPGSSTSGQRLSFFLLSACS